MRYIEQQKMGTSILVFLRSGTRPDEFELHFYYNFFPFIFFRQKFIFVLLRFLYPVFGRN